MKREYATVDDHFGYTFARHGVPVRTQNNWVRGGNVLVIATRSEHVVRIADSDGWSHGAPSDWTGGRAIVCPADEDSGTIMTGEVLYQSPGPGDFPADSARLICAALEFLRANGAPPPQETGEVDEDLALAHLALTDAGWKPGPGDEPEGWRDELRAGHAAYLDGKAWAVGVNELETLTRAAEAQRFDLSPYENLREAREAMRHGAISSWQRTPYGTVWVDDAK